MKVVDASYDDVDSFCCRILGELKGDNFFCQSESESRLIVVGVASGGIPIAKSFFRQAQDMGLNPVYGEVTCQRPSTTIKKKSIFSIFFKYLLRVLPKIVLNYLRVFEHKFLSKNRVEKRDVFTSLTSLTCRDKLVVIDDAVDSGYSLKAVVDALRKEDGPVIITAAYTVTQETPVYTPDFYERNGDLVRFPWAADA